jgi:hypothetical protein
MSISSFEAAFYRSAAVDPARVGPVLGSGAQNLVRALREEGKRPKVIKAPLDAVRGRVQDYAASLIAGQSRESAEHELGVSQQYFGQYLPHTEIRPTADGKRFVLIQDQIDFTSITPAILEASDDVRGQLEEIMSANAKMIHNEGLWIDAMGFNTRKLAAFLGPDGVPYMDNIVLEKDTNNVHVIDVGLFGFGPKHLLQYLVQHENARRFGLSFDGR